MAEWIATLRGALLLDAGAIARTRDRYDGFLRGMLLVAVVGLFATLPTFIGDVANGFRGVSPAQQETAAARAAFENGLQQAATFMPGLPPAQRDLVLSQARSNFELGMNIGTAIAALPTPLPQPIGQLLRAAGNWLSRPLGEGGFLPLTAAALGTWLGYGIWVMLAAKLLGGRGTLTGFFAATALFAVPHVLQILGWVQVLGGILGFVAFLWGAAIYVKATAVSHELSMGRALLAATLPALAALALLGLTLIGLLSVIGLALMGR